jgi:predicted small metal-binding protein
MHSEDMHSEEQKGLHFNCSDVVAKNCDWQVSGNIELEIMMQIEKHAREKHGLELDDETLNGVHYAIHKEAA